MSPTAGWAEAPASRILPPWLWIWLAIFLYHFPAQLRFQWRPLLAEVLSASHVPGEALIPFGTFLRLATVAELAPLLLVLLGVASVFLPKLRGRVVHRRYGATAPPDTPALREIAAFLTAHAPRMRVAVNLRRADALALVYPTGIRSATLVLFGGLLKLWRGDRETAEAVLLHEIAHHRQGDPAILGAGSLFEALLDRWLPLMVAGVVGPLLLVWGYDAAVFVLDGSVAGPILAHKAAQAVTLFGPRLVSVSLGLLLWAASVIALPLAGIWCAELNADRWAAARAPAGLVAAVTRLTSGSSWRRRLLFQMSHPPVALRRWAARQQGRLGGLLVVLLIFPVAYLARLLMLLARAALAYAASSPGAPAGQALLAHARGYLSGVAPLWLGFALVLLAWPMVSAGWERLFAGRGTEAGVAEHPAYLAASAILGIAGACAW